MKLHLETDRLLLRPFSLEDAEAMFYGWANDEAVTKYLTWNAHENIDATREILTLWVEQYEKPERINFAIVEKQSGELIGGIDVCGYIDGVPVLGYCLARKHWNKGYMTEACQKVLGYLFSIGHTLVKIDALVENIGSNAVIQKCGGVLQCCEEEFFSAKNKTMLINRYVVKNCAKR